MKDDLHEIVREISTNVAVLSTEQRALTKTVDHFVASVEKKHGSYDEQHRDHYKATTAQGKDISKAKGIIAVCSFLGLGGVVALIKGVGQ